jgi:hypothetical protein
MANPMCSACHVPMTLIATHEPARLSAPEATRMSHYGIVRRMFRCPTCDAIEDVPPDRVRERLAVARCS